MSTLFERGIPMDGLEAAATRAAELVKPLFDIARQRVHTLEVELQRAQVKIVLVSHLILCKPL